MKIFDLLKSGDKNLSFFLFSYFFVLLNYPLIRASTTTMFFEEHGAKSSPVAWLWSVIFLSLTIAVCNWLQKRASPQWIFCFIGLVSVAIFFMSYFRTLNSFASFIWKEIYIVVHVHLLLAYANSSFKKDDFKLLIGPLGAVGSLGGIIGGLLTSYLSGEVGTDGVVLAGCSFVFVPSLLFLFTQPGEGHAEDKKKSPLATLDSKEVRRYVFTIAAIVALSQFIINIADFKFNLAFEKTFSEATSRTSYLGHVYTVTNVLTFILQIFILPWLLPRASEQRLHFFIPLSYVLFFCLSFLFTGFVPIAVLYIYLKASDYSLFSAGKEVLYQPLTQSQKYGAKYLTDMLVYRVAKAVIAAVLIYLQSSLMLNILMASFLMIWVAMVFGLFRARRNLFI